MLRWIMVELARIAFYPRSEAEIILKRVKVARGLEGNKLTGK